MALIFDALKQVKGNVDLVNFVVQREEDTLAVSVLAMEASLREQETKNKILISNVDEFEMAVKLSDSEYLIGIVQKESLVSQIDGMKYQSEDIQKRIDQKAVDMDQIFDIKGIKERELLELQLSNHAAYLEIPIIREYIEASDAFADYSEILSELTVELDNLRTKYGPLCGIDKENDAELVSKKKQQQQTIVEVIQLESSTTQVTPEMKGIQEILMKFAEMTEENRLLKRRLERLELANKTSFPREPSTPANESISVQSKPNAPQQDNHSGGTRFTFKLPTSMVSKKNSFPLENALFNSNGNEIYAETPASLQTTIPFEGEDELDFNFGTPGGSFF